MAGTEITSYKSLHEENGNIGGVSTSDINPTNISLDNKEDSSDDDDMLIMSGFNAPTPRSPDDDMVLALQESTNDSSLCVKIMGSCFGCCCCCVIHHPLNNQPNNHHLV